MNNSKLINILRTFSKNEMKEFERFITSPFFNKGRNYVPFFKQVKKFHPRFDDERLTPEYIYSKMYPGKKFNRQIIWNTTSSMVNIAEEFLVNVSLSGNAFAKKEQLANQYLERKLSPYYSKALDEMENALEKTGLDKDFFRNKTLLETGRMSYHFLEDTQHLLFENIRGKGEYALLSFMKDMSSVMGGLKVSSNMYNTELLENIPYIFTSGLQIKKTIDFAKKNKYKYAPVLEMYYFTIMLVLEPENTEHFFTLKKLFEDNSRLFSQQEKYLWTVDLANYCVQKINDGQPQFRQSIFELDKFRLKAGLAYPGKYFPKIQFMLILGNALAVNEIDWCRKFIADYITRIKPSFQKAVKSLSYASINYKLKDYNNVLDKLSKVNFTDPIDKLHIRSLYIRVYYELDEIETLIYYIEATKSFLNKNVSLGDGLKGYFSRFLYFIGKIITAKEKNDDFELHKLKETIYGDKTIWYRDWMLEKIDKMKIQGMKKSRLQKH